LLAALPPEQRPLGSYTLILELVHRHVEPACPADAGPRILQALRAAPQPMFSPLPGTAQGGEWPAAVINRATGAVRYPAKPSRQAPAGSTRLPLNGQWLLSMCRTHGWELYDMLPTPPGRVRGAGVWPGAYVALFHFARMLIARSADSCDYYTSAVRHLLPIPQHPDPGGDPRFSLQALVRSRALRAYQAAHDIARVFAGALSSLAD
jgi:hypothetical protein